MNSVDLSRNRRRHPRLPVSLKVEYRAAGKQGSGHIVDLSLGGMFLQVAGEFGESSWIDISFRVRNGEERQPVQCSGKILRVLGIQAASKWGLLPGIALQFTRFDQGFDALRQYLGQRCGVLPTLADPHEAAGPGEGPAVTPALSKSASSSPDLSDDASPRPDRGMPRLATNRKVHYRCGSAGGHAYTLDLSVGGMFLQVVPERLPEKWLHLDFPVRLKSAEHRIRCIGRVVRLLTSAEANSYGLLPGVAIQFQRYEAGEAELRSYLAERLGVALSDLGKPDLGPVPDGVQASDRLPSMTDSGSEMLPQAATGQPTSAPASSSVSRSSRGIRGPATKIPTASSRQSPRQRQSREVRKKRKRVAERSRAAYQYAGPPPASRKVSRLLKPDEVKGLDGGAPWELKNVEADWNKREWEKYLAPLEQGSGKFKVHVEVQPAEPPTGRDGWLESRLGFGFAHLAKLAALGVGAGFLLAYLAVAFVI